MPKEIKTLLAKKGFTLIEILLSIFLILGLITLLFSTASTYVHSRNSDIQTLATSIASTRMENLRHNGFAALPASGSFTDPNLSKLPNSTATQTISNYQGSTKIKLVSVKVAWRENNINKNIKIETLFSESGI